MKLFSKCKVCNKRKFIIKIRYIKIKHVKEPITSKSHLCRGCYKEMIKLLQTN